MERERRGRDYWREQLSEYWDGGLTIQEYCELKDLPYESVRRWIGILKKEREGKSPASGELEFVRFYHIRRKRAEREKFVMGIMADMCIAGIPHYPGRYNPKNDSRLEKRRLQMKEKNFTELDENFKSRNIGNTMLEFYDGFSTPFSLEGFSYMDTEGHRSRLPLNIARQCEKEGVYPMSMQGAGEIIRFRTDSPKIGVRAEFSEIFIGNHRNGSAGFDLYAGKGIDSKFCGNRVIAPGEKYFEGLYKNLQTDCGEVCDYTLYFPFHCAVSAISVGIVPGSVIEPPTPHKIKKPVVFYGSSITNCGAAGRPGLVYPSIISRHLDFHLINMGFSGSCRGELCIADTICL